MIETKHNKLRDKTTYLETIGPFQFNYLCLYHRIINNEINELGKEAISEIGESIIKKISKPLNIKMEKRTKN